MDSLVHFNNLIALLNRSMSGQFFMVICQNLIRIILILFMTAFRFVGDAIEEEFSTLAHFTAFIFRHHLILGPCLLGDLISRKVRESFHEIHKNYNFLILKFGAIYKMHRKIFNSSKNCDNRLLEIDIECEKLGCGLADFTMEFGLTVEIFFFILIQAKKISLFPAFLD